MTIIHRVQASDDNRRAKQRTCSSRSGGCPQNARWEIYRIPGDKSQRVQRPHHKSQRCQKPSRQARERLNAKISHYDKLRAIAAEYGNTAPRFSPISLRAA
jgi:hypothetical protein